MSLSLTRPEPACTLKKHAMRKCPYKSSALPGRLGKDPTCPQCSPNPDTRWTGKGGGRRKRKSKKKSKKKKSKRKSKRKSKKRKSKKKKSKKR